jgi:hypothetical protein
MPDAESSILNRIERTLRAGDVTGSLAEGIPAGDLQAVLLAVMRRRVAALRPADLLERYERNRFARPSGLPPALLLELERRAHQALPQGFEALALSPVCPLGTVGALTSVSQNSVLSATRGTEVVSDPTNVLALECAVRRRALLRSERGSTARVSLAAAHRTLRAQRWDEPGFSQHFALFGLCTAGRDEGSFAFEAEALRRHLGFYLRLLGGLADLGLEPRGLRAEITPIGGERCDEIRQAVTEPLALEFPHASIAIDGERTRAVGYYAGACLRVAVDGPLGDELELVDGGFTTWTQQLLGNRKERLLISGIGLERLAGAIVQA